MNKRDPRVDPRPGDMVLYGPQWQQECVEVIDTTASHITYKGESGRPFICTRNQWEVWTKGAEVLHVAGS